MKKRIHETIDKKFLILTAILASVGFFVFSSASLGPLVKEGSSFKDIFFDQFVLGVLLGIIVLFVALYTPLNIMRKYALHLFIGSMILTSFVFLPVIGFEHGGAHRWINLGFVSFQPSELLKLAAVIYFASLLPRYKDRLPSMKYSLGILLAVAALPGTLLLKEPDTGTFAVLFAALSAMLVAAGAKLRHFFVLVIIAVVAVGVLAMVKPYVKERLITFLDSSYDPQGSSYQLQKSLLAIGSGGLTGRGFGQSIQKYSSLPEPTGDSVFAVAGEEFGFIGCTILILLFLLFGVRGIHIALRAPDMFSGLLAVGIVILIVSQSFANIAAMLGLIPLTGVPLVFVSHGGTALLFAFLEIGILLNISKHKQ